MRSTLLLTALPSLLVAQETSTTLKDQKALAVTIYNDNLALVKDTREVRLGSPGYDPSSQTETPWGLP